uniref:Uncharacterized protein n=1 Tax=Hyaloperonospora arabidopsidis (strain Emoy2) TaxID=559515 RepID=M4BAE1_HYAAE
MVPTRAAGGGCSCFSDGCPSLGPLSAARGGIPFLKLHNPWLNNSCKPDGGIYIQLKSEVCP